VISGIPVTGGNNPVGNGHAAPTGRGHENAGLGSHGEALAAAFLQRNGMKILERNFRCKGGEVDIVAKDGETIVFVEVKTRRTLTCGPPQAAVTGFKQRQISKAALAWLGKNRMQDPPSRFDVIAILVDNRYTHQVEHIRNAFELSY
jgi:putative endonuclease